MDQYYAIMAENNIMSIRYFLGFIAKTFKNVVI